MSQNMQNSANEIRQIEIIAHEAETETISTLLEEYIRLQKAERVQRTGVSIF